MHVVSLIFEYPHFGRCFCRFVSGNQAEAMKEEDIPIDIHYNKLLGKDSKNLNQLTILIDD